MLEGMRRESSALPPGLLPEKLGWGMRPTCQNPCAIYDQYLRFFLPYLRPDQKFDTLWTTVGADIAALNIIYNRRAFADGLIDIVIKKVAFFGETYQFKTRVHPLYPIIDQSH